MSKHLERELSELREKVFLLEEKLRSAPIKKTLVAPCYSNAERYDWLAADATEVRELRQFLKDAGIKRTVTINGGKRSFGIDDPAYEDYKKIAEMEKGDRQND